MADSASQSPRMIARSQSSTESPKREGGGGETTVRMFGRLRRFVSGGSATDRKRVLKRSVTAHAGLVPHRDQQQETDNKDKPNFADKKLQSRGRDEEKSGGNNVGNHTHGEELSVRVLRMRSDEQVNQVKGKQPGVMSKRASLRAALGWEGGYWRRSVRDMRDRLTDAEGRVQTLGREKKELENKLKQAEKETMGLKNTLNEMEKVSSANYLERTFLQDDLAQSRKERDAWHERSRYLEQVSEQADLERANAITEMNRARLLQEEIAKEKIRTQEELKCLRADFNKLMMKAVSMSLDIDFTQFGTHSPITPSPTRTRTTETESHLSDASSDSESTSSLLKSEIKALLIELEKSRSENRMAALECRRLEKLLTKEREMVQNYEEDCAMLRQQVVSFAARHERIVKELRQVKANLKPSQAELPPSARKVLSPGPYLEPATLTDENCNRGNLTVVNLTSPS